ncbi:uncharacterized protein B0T23DRAFT_158505 [Neurospora hispaniola]|uniref:Nephrocystin 3-like N-terminal domain-containing protein n=1 Tax=Neurospora hispaniola TaxID=588809 RepID=A0AAJ0I512_9PEZI|nr:hypothetical protein B0T23DRAFT_158505 [Neurospora hispaniola]
MKPLFVVINGLDDLESNNSCSTEKRNSIQAKPISDLWPDAEVRIFDLFDKNAPPSQVNEIYLIQHARRIIRDLNCSDDVPLRTYANPSPVVFLAHNCGAALVQKILFLAIQDISSQWLAIWAVAVHFVNSLAVVNDGQSEWEHYVVNLLSNTKMGLWHLSGIFEKLPSALLQVGVEFSAIADAFSIHYHSIQSTGSDKTLRGLWGLHNGQEGYVDMLASIHGALHQDWWDSFRETRRPFWERFYHRYIAVGGGSLGWLIPDRQGQPYSFLQSSFHDKPPFDLKSWMESSRSEILLVVGSPESGTRSLACWALTTLQQTPSALKADMMVLSYDFTAQNARPRTESSVLTSLIQQIIMLSPDSCLHVKRHMKSIFRSNMPYVPCNLLWSLLRTLLEAVKPHRIFLVIHAIDQCPQDAPRAGTPRHPRAVGCKLADLLLISQGPLARHVKILMTSSNDLGLKQENQIRRFDLKEDSCRDIVKRVAKERVSKVLSQASAWRDFEPEIMEKICVKDHTYLQTMLNIGLLEQSTIPATKEAIKCWLSKPLPFGAESALFEVHDVMSARNILSWVSYAVRPLTLRELSVAVALQGLSLTDALMIGNMSLELLEAKVSSNLARDIENPLKILIDIEDDQHVTLAHHTLRPYLEKEGTWLWPEQHASIASCCLSYMKLCSQHNTENDAPQPENSALDDAFALLEYSQIYWTQHYVLARSSNDDLDEQVLDFLTSGSESPALRSWAEAYQTIHDKAQLEQLDIDDPLTLAVQLGLSRIVRVIVGRENVQQQPERLEKALSLSAKSMPLTSEIMGYLLPHKLPSHDLSPALLAAAQYGNTDCLGLLLDHMGGSLDGLLQSAQAPENQDPVLLAVSGGHTSTVELLLNRGCSVLREDTVKNTTLHLAAQLGDAETLSIMKTLQKTDFSIARRLKSTPRDLTPLGLACRIGSSPTIDILLEDCGTEDGSPPFGLPTADILVNIMLTGNLTMYQKLAVMVKNPFSQSYERFSTPLFARTASMEVLKYFVEVEEKSIEGDADNAHQDTPKKAFNDGIYDSIRCACECLNDDLAIWLWRKLDQPGWDVHFRTAVQHGSLPLLKHLLNHGYPLDKTLSTKYGVTTWVERIHTAVFCNHVDVVRYLAQTMAKARDSVIQHLKPKKPELASLLIRAAHLNYVFCLRELLREIFVPFDLSEVWGIVLENVVTGTSLTSLMDVCELKPKGYKLSSSLGITALRRALTLEDTRRLERVDVLLNKGILKPSLADNGDTSALHVAVGEEPYDVNVVKLLLQAGASPNVGKVYSHTPLHVAVKKGLTDIFHLLLQHGGDPNICDYEGQNALHLAIRDGRNDMIRLLLDPWIQPERHGRDHSSSRMPPALSRRNTERRRVSHPTPDLLSTDNLKRPSMDAPTADMHKKTPLILAVEKRLIDVVHKLLLAGANPNLQASDGCTPLNIAIWTGSLELVRMLIENKADVNKITSHPFGSPLHFLVRRRPKTSYFQNVAELLFQNNANVKAQDLLGFTPLMRYLCQYQAPVIAVDPAPPSVLEKLTEETALPIANTFGKTALHYAAFFSNTCGMVIKLLQAGADPLARDNLGHRPLYYGLLNVDRAGEMLPDLVPILISAIPPSARRLTLSEAIIAAVKTGLERPLDMILEAAGEGFDFLDNPDNSGYRALDIASSFGKGFETACQKIINLGGKAALDDEKQTPTQWNKDDRSEYLDVSENGTEVSSIAYPIDSNSMLLIGTVRADHPIPTNKPFYFEVEVVELPILGCVYDENRNWLSNGTMYTTRLRRLEKKLMGLSQ